MANELIHLSVSKKVNEVLKYDEDKLFLGSLAPDLSDLVGRKRFKSHFYTNNKCTDINIDKFVKKYRRSLKKPFEMGYFIHLYTDKLWDEVSSSDLFDVKDITLSNGLKIKVKKNDAKKIIDSDFSNINNSLIKKYDINTSMFEKEIKSISTRIDEIPIKKLNLIISEMNNTLAKSKKGKTVVIDEKNIYSFIENASSEIINYLKEKNIIE